MSDQPVDPASLPHPPHETREGIMPDWAPVMEKSHAEEPVEFRIQRAYLNGFADGLHRGTQGRLDR